MPKAILNGFAKVTVNGVNSKLFMEAESTVYGGLGVRALPNVLAGVNS